jgi:hypothetical protein
MLFIRLMPNETASQFARDVAGAINAEVESRVDRMVRTIELSAREAYAKETACIVAKAEAKARQDAKSQADLAFQTIFDRDLKVNHTLSDISLEDIRQEFRVQLETVKAHIQTECEEDVRKELTAFRAHIQSLAAPLLPSNDLVVEVTSWAQVSRFKQRQQRSRRKPRGQEAEPRRRMEEDA